MDLSGDLDDPRGAESGVSWTRFDTDLTLMRSICQMQDIVCIGNSHKGERDYRTESGATGFAGSADILSALSAQRERSLSHSLFRNDSR